MSRTLAFAAAAALAVPAFAQDRTDRPQDLQDRQLQDAPDRQADRTVNRPISPPGDASAVTAETLARWASQDNQAEIALAEFAKQKTQNPAVRQFAEKMIQAHTKFGEKLDAVAEGRTPTPGRSDAANRRSSGFRAGDLPAGAPRDAAPGALPDEAPGALPDDPAADAGDLPPGAPRDPAPGTLEDVLDDTDDPAVDPATDPAASPTDDPLNPYRADVGRPVTNDDFDNAADPPAADGAARRTRPDADRPNRNRMNRDRNRNRGGMTAGATAADVLAFREQLKKQCGETLKTNFDKLSPADFDKAYASQQIGAHLSMIDTLTLAQQQADGEAAEVFAAGVRETKMHLNEAIQLLNQVTPANVN